MTAVQFLLNGKPCSADNAPPSMTVLDWLRTRARLTGTKEGCAEGDCGACTIVLGRRLDGSVQFQAVNSCLMMLPQIDNCALLTVEGLAAADGALHPVQQALVDTDATQCGFCTPGFVMAMFAFHHGGEPADSTIVHEALAGNLCRCTGYRPIIDAGERMFALPAAPLDAAPVRAALATLRESAPLHSVGPDGGEFLAPRTLAEFAAARLADADAHVLAGSTDIGLWVNKLFRELPRLLYVGAVAELTRIEVQGGVLSIGAAASLEDAWRALVARWPPLAEVWLRFAGVPLRHTGTMGGNVANGSPIGDSAPVLMALDATLLLRRGDATRRVPLADFYTGYMQSVLAPGEFVQAIEVPLGDAAAVRAYKVSKRFDCDISAVCAGLAIARDAGITSAARLAFGGMAATVQRARGAEAALVGRPWDERALAAAQAALASDFAPLTDMRASAGYRLQVAQNLLTRFWLETRADAPLAPAAPRVWSERPAEAATASTGARR
jgi:xanthine dehydrogenase small subunit